MELGNKQPKRRATKQLWPRLGEARLCPMAWGDRATLLSKRPWVVHFARLDGFEKMGWKLGFLVHV